jgi:hypothetical protein
MHFGEVNMRLQHGGAQPGKGQRILEGLRVAIEVEMERRLAVGQNRSSFGIERAYFVETRKFGKELLRFGSSRRSENSAAAATAKAVPRIPYFSMVNLPS